MSMAVLQEVDRCTKCRGCVVACQRNFKWDVWVPAVDTASGTGLALAADTSAERIRADDATVVKSQVATDFPPYVKYNCWQCPSPPCMAACPRGAISKKSDGSVYIKRVAAPGRNDRQFCNPLDPKCWDNAGRLKCVAACARGGYPIRGLGDGANDKIWKCDMCWERRLPGFRTVSGAGSTENTTVTFSNTTYGEVADLVPGCVQACPAKALRFGDLGVLQQYLVDQQYPYRQPESMDGNWLWARRGAPFGSPTADPLAEDHMAPILQALLHSPVGKVLLVPTMMVGGLYALYTRRLKIESEKVKAI